MDKKMLRKLESARIENDRGDNARRVLRIPKNKMDNETQVENNNLGDRGDAAKRNEESKRKLETNQVLKSQIKSRYLINHRDYPGSNVTEKSLRKTQEKFNKSVRPLDIATRRKIHQMYTFKRVCEDNSVAKDNNEKIGKLIRLQFTNTSIQVNTVDEDTNEKYNPVTYWTADTRNVEALTTATPVKRATPEKKTNNPSQKSLSDTPTKSDSLGSKKCRSPSTDIRRPPSSKRQSTKHVNRKLVIKTITHKGDTTKIYKAVSFVDQHSNKAPLKVHLTRQDATGQSTPSQRSKESNSRGSSDSVSSSHKIKVTNSPNSIEKLIFKRKEKSKCRRKRYTSPELRVPSAPMTEVAKWAPSSVNEHTKPYYEAWVDTTLTAISKDEAKMRKEKLKILQQMQEQLDQYNGLGMSESDFSDERYTGRIRVNHKSNKSK